MGVTVESLEIAEVFAWIDCGVGESALRLGLGVMGARTRVIGNQLRTPHIASRTRTRTGAGAFAIMDGANCRYGFA